MFVFAALPYVMTMLPEATFTDVTYLPIGASLPRSAWCGQD